MYSMQDPQELSGLGFSLKPPKWLRKAASAVGSGIKSIIGGGQAQAGPIVIQATPGGPLAPPPNQTAFQFPGGNTGMIVAGVAVLGLGVLLLSRGRGRR